MNLLGIHLTLLLGPTVPAPAPPELLEALQEVKVTHDDSAVSGFQITFRVGRSSSRDLTDFAFLRNPLLLRPVSRVLLMVSFGLEPQVLMDGFITRQELTPSSSPGSSTLTVYGEDVSVTLNQVEKSDQHPAQNEKIIAEKIISSYGQFGLIPQVAEPPVVDTPAPAERTPVQQRTDFQHLRQMAERHGYVFFVIPGPTPMKSVAYWGPPPRLSARQKALSVDLGAETNVDQISFSSDACASKLMEGQVQDRQTNRPTPVRTVAGTRPPLVAEPAWKAQPMVCRRQLRESGLTTTQAYGRAQAKTDASTDGAVTATGQLDALRYGALLQARGLVDLRGAGWRHDGTYYVKSVTHSIKMGEYKQSFTLQREGWGSLTPMVLP